MPILVFNLDDVRFKNVSHKELKLLLFVKFLFFSSMFGRGDENLVFTIIFEKEFVFEVLLVMSVLSLREMILFLTIAKEVLCLKSL